MLNSMKIAVVKDNSIVISDAPRPTLNGNKGAIIKTLGCGLCGSDIVKFTQHLVPDGKVLGHEALGSIVEINSSSDFKLGDNIVSSHHIPCFTCSLCKQGHYSMCKHFKATNIFPGGFSEYIYLSEEHLLNVAHLIPDNLSNVEASFYEPLGCCVRAVKRASLPQNSNALVIGLGSIGILMAQAINAMGAVAYGSDLIPERVNLANSLGIKAFNPAVASSVPDMKFDTIFMTSGADATIKVALNSVADGGKIVVFSSTPKNLGYDNNEIYYRELTVMGSYSPSPDDLNTSLSLLAHKTVMVDSLSTVYNFHDINQAFCDTIDNKILKAYIKF